MGLILEQFDIAFIFERIQIHLLSVRYFTYSYMDSTANPDMDTSTSMDQLQIPPPYNQSVIWPHEYTVSLEQSEDIRNAFRKTYMRIQKAGCHFLFLEPTTTAKGYLLLLYSPITI